MIQLLWRRTEQFFQTDITYIVRGGSWIGVSKLVSAFASFLLLLAFGNLVSKTTYGVYQYVLSVAGILSVTTLPGMTTALNQAVAQGKEGVMMPMFYTRVRWGILGGLISLGVGIYYFLQGNTDLTLAFGVAALFLPFMDSLTLWSPLLVGRKDFKYSSLYSSLFHILRVASIVAVLFITQHLVIIIVSYFFFTTLWRLVLTIVVFFIHKPNKELSYSYISYGKHLSLMGVLGAIATQADKILLWHFLGPIALATYSFALTPINQLQSWFKTLESLAFPKFASIDSEVLKKTLPKKLVRLLVFILPIIVLYVLLAPWLYSIFLPQYMESVIYSQVFAVILLFLPQKLLASSLVAKSQKKSLYIITTINPLSKILLLLILVPLFGVWGAIAGTMLPYCINFFTLTYFFRKIS